MCCVSYKTSKLCSRGAIKRRGGQVLIQLNAEAHLKHQHIRTHFSSTDTYTMNHPNPNPHPRHPHAETGISDEAAEEGHDLIARAEEEEERVRDMLKLQTNALG